MKRSLEMAILLALLMLAPCLSQRAVAAPGDFVLEWGEKYHFVFPLAVAVDRKGDVFVADSGHQKIQKFDRKGSFITEWGPGVANRPDMARGPYPSWLTVDESGNVYVPPWQGSKVIKYDNNGTQLAEIATPGSGADQMVSPSCVAVDRQGNLYVSDNVTNMIYKFDASGKYLLHWGGTGSADGQFNDPVGVAVDGQGTVYVSDTGNARIQKFGSDGTFLAGWGVGDVRPFNLGKLAVDDAGRVYALEGLDSRVLVFTNTGRLVRTIGSPGSGLGQLQSPYGLAVDRHGKVYVADTGNVRVSIFTREGTPVANWESSGTGKGQFSYAWGVAVGTNGTVYVADRGRVEVFTGTGRYRSQFGSFGSGDGQLSIPAGVALDKSGNVYVADFGNQRVEVFTAAGVFLRTIGSPGSGDGELSSPSGVAVGPNGNVYVADTGNSRVEVYNGTGGFLGTIGGPGYGAGEFIQPTGVAVDSRGNLYVADFLGIKKFDSAGKYLTELGGSGEGEIADAVAVTVDASGYLYVTDLGFDPSNTGVKVFTSEGPFVKQWGQYGSVPGRFDTPRGIAVDPMGTTLYVSDLTNNRIQAFVGFGGTHFAVSAPASATAGSAITFTVTALDASNNIAGGYSGMIHFTSSDDTALLPADAPLVNGTGTFSAILGKGGKQTITATDSATPSLTGTSNRIATDGPKEHGNQD